MKKINLSELKKIRGGEGETASTLDPWKIHVL